MTKDLAQIYDGFADTYEENRGLFDMTEVFDSFYARLNQQPGRVLDLGCGAGEPFSKLFIDQGWAVTGVDFSQRMLALAAEHVPEMSTVNADMRTVEFDSGCFDAITAIYSLFHIPWGEHDALFKKMYGWLSLGGSAFFTYATQNYTGSEAFSGFKEFMGQSLYYSHQTPENLAQVLDSVGFVIDGMEQRQIGGEVFLWVTVTKPL